MMRMRSSQLTNLSVPSNLVLWLIQAAKVAWQGLEDLIPVNLKMHQQTIMISSYWVPQCMLRLSGKDSMGEEKSTRQMVYVTNHTDKLFLSRGGMH